MLELGRRASHYGGMAWRAICEPVQLTRETIDIVRMIARGDRLEYEGELFQLPPDGFGRSMRSLARACEPIPMYIASLGPRNLELTGEIADGWLGNAMMPEAADALWGRCVPAVIALVGRSVTST